MKKITLFIIILLISNYSFSQRLDSPRIGADEIDKARGKNKDSVNGNDSGVLILGGILLGGIIYSYSQSSRYTKSRYYNSRHGRRFVPRPPGLILSASVPLYKTEVNEHWQRGVSSEFKAELLIIGNRGRYPNFGLYGNIGVSNYRYKLPFTSRQYFIGHDFVQDGDPTLAYAVINQVTEEEKSDKKIILSEKSRIIGISFKTFFRQGIFIDIGAGIKLNRNVKIKFVENFRYLGGTDRLKRNDFLDVVNVDNNKFLFNLSDSFFDIGIGKMFQGRKLPFNLKLNYKGYRLDYSTSENFKVYLETTGGIDPLNYENKLGHSVNIEIAFIFGRFMK